MKLFVTFTLFLLAVQGTLVFGQQDSAVASEAFPYDTDLLPASFHASRRQLLRDSMPAGSVAVLFAGPERTRSNDVDYEYHQDPDFYYLTGLREPHAMLLVFKEDYRFRDSLTKEIIFVQDRDEEKEIWTGRRYGQRGVEAQFEIETVLLSSDFAGLTFDFSPLQHVFHHPIPGDVRDDKKNKGDLYSLYRHFARRIAVESVADKVDDRKLKSYMAALREIKTSEELVLMKKAIEMTCAAQNELMRMFEPGMKEYEAEALIEYYFKKNGAEYPGFPSILGGGENSCILHYTSNRKKLDSNHLMVVDVGAEYHGYTADVTRTFPVDGKFSEEERQIYELVLAAQKAGIEAAQKGNKFWDPHDAATRVIQRGLIELGIIKKYYESRRYFMHGTSHYLGLDVHDAGSYGSLKPGAVITVEPGIYIPAGSPCDEKWWNIGVRIEDDILITTAGPVNLSDCIPREVDAIEALMKEKSIFNQGE
jgi:Xaa-Pro aminopeptidase